MANILNQRFHVSLLHSWRSPQAWGEQFYATQREIGVRMAVGARPADVVRLVLTEGGALVVGGLLLGVPAALAAARVMRSQLYGVEPTDPHTFVIVSVVLCAAALLAMLAAAIRASRVDPVVALRGN